MSATTTTHMQAGIDAVRGTGTPSASTQVETPKMTQTQRKPRKEDSTPSCPPGKVTQKNEPQKANELKHLVSQMEKHWPERACPRTIWDFFCRRFDAYINFLLESWLIDVLDEESAYRRWHVSWYCARNPGATRVDACRQSGKELKARVEEAYLYFVNQIFEDLGTTSEETAALARGRETYGLNKKLIPLWRRKLVVDERRGQSLSMWDCRRLGLSDQQDKPEMWKDQAVANAKQWDSCTGTSSHIPGKRDHGKEPRAKIRLPGKSLLLDTNSVEFEMNDFGRFRFWRSDQDKSGNLPEILITCED